MKKLRWFDLMSINLFWLGLNTRNNAVGSIFLPFLVDAFFNPDTRNTALGGIRTASLVIAMLVQPAMGILSDRSTSRFGRRRPFIFVGVLFDLVFLAALAVAANSWMLLVVMLLMQFSANISHGPLQGLIPDMVPEQQRGVASAWKAIFELLPLILLGFTIAPLVAAGKFTWAIVATGGGLTAAMLLTMLLVKEKPLGSPIVTPLAPEILRVLGMLAGIAAGAAAGLAAGALLGGAAGLLTWIAFGSQAAYRVGFAVGGAAAMATAVLAGVWAGTRLVLGQEALQHKDFTWWVVNRLLFLAAVTSIQTFAPFFLMYTFDVNREEAAGMTGGLLMAVGIFTLLSALPGGWLSDRLGQRRLVALSGMLAAAGTAVVLVTVWLPRLPLIYLAGGIIGLATGLFVTTNWAMGTRLAPAGESGRYLGVSNLAGAGAGIVGSGIGGPVADILNNSLPGLGYFSIFTAYLLLFVMSSLVLLKIRRAA